MFRRHKKENKAKLEHKLYLAREDPEPVFDLSECDIDKVPSGIYSLCRVFLKESLKLNNNYLSCLNGGGNLRDLHLLKVLDLRHNVFSGIPEDISQLKSLNELYLSNNQVKKLPSSLCSLNKLKILDVSHNLLKNLPENIGELISLQKLLIKGNNRLKMLPKSICKAQKLLFIDMDTENFEYPTFDICEKGTEAIIQFICDDTGFEYISPTDFVDSSFDTNNETSLSHFEENDLFQAKIWKLEKIKEQKTQDFLEIERMNEIHQKQELELANMQKENRKKLLTDITLQQSKFDKDLAKIQQMRDIERFQLIEQLQTTEQNAELAIKKLLSLNSQPLAELLEREKEEERRLIQAANKYNENLRKDDILLKMQELLDSEYCKFKEFEEERKEMAQNALKQELICDSKIADILQYKDLEQIELMSKLLEDSELQKYAVGTLLEKLDARSWGILQQVKLVEKQLAALTTIEIDRRKLEMDLQINDLAENRLNLSMLLMDLLDQQNSRRIQLLSTLQNLEEKNRNESNDFWLKQYQRLLDQMPQGLLDTHRNIDPQLSQCLLMSGVIHSLPFLIKIIQNTDDDLLNVSDDDLKKAGVYNPEDRDRIIEAFRYYSKMIKSTQAQNNSKTNPEIEVEVEENASAPLIDETISTFATSECVICMDNNCQVIFLPCGHYCSCFHCSTPLVECPMCRGGIEKKIKVMNS